MRRLAHLLFLIQKDVLGFQAVDQQVPLFACVFKTLTTNNFFCLCSLQISVPTFRLKETCLQLSIPVFHCVNV